MKAIIERLRIAAALAVLFALGAGSAWGEADYINVNFYYLYSSTYAYTAVSLENNCTARVSDELEGLAPYAIAGKYWSDVNVGSSTAQSVMTYDSAAESASESTVTVTVSGTRGGYFSASQFEVL